MIWQQDITLLWTGSLLHKDNALQLVLIVDYIMDWARDVYRIAIMRQLKSLVTGKPYDQISLADSDIFSMRRDISNWIPAPPSTVFGGFTESAPVVNSQDYPPSTSLEEQAIPNSKHGSVRPVSSANFRFVCLHLTERLVPSFLQVVGGPWDNKSNKEKAARLIINFITQFDEVLVMSYEDLNLFEMLWTDAAAPTGSYEDSDGLYYIVMEASWYFSSSWDIIREVSCLAVTKSAFNILETYANFGAGHKGIKSLPNCVRHCTSSYIREFIDCIRSGSPWQVLLATISCTLVTIYPFYVSGGGKFENAFGLGYTHYDRVKPFIMNYLKLNLWKPRQNTSVPAPEVNRLLRQGYKMSQILDMKREPPPTHTDMSWKRISEKLRVLKDESHDRSRCCRCMKSPRRSNLSPFAHGFLDTRNEPVLSEYNAILVTSLQCTGREIYSPDSCVFTLGKINKPDDNNELSLLIKNLLNAGLIYHTLKYDVEYATSRFEGMYNLPLPYRSVTNEEMFRLLNWIHEQDENFQVHKEDELQDELQDERSEFNSTRVLMYLLRIGHTEQEASLFMTRGSLYKYEGIFFYMERESRGENEKLESSLSPKKVSICGEVLAQRYSSWIEGKVYLKDKNPTQFDYIASLNVAMNDK